MQTSQYHLEQAYQFCINMAKNHYENFPVASRLLEKDLRYPISAVYAFARSADDFADEGELSTQQRLDLLENYVKNLKRIEQRLADNSNQQTALSEPIFIALEDVIQRFNVPIELFYDLLRAFKQDVTKTRYHNFAEVLDYCKYSANPVGRILLYLNKSAKPENLHYSDAICTGLQLINFYQDIAQDIDENDRLYLPVDEMAQHGVSVDDLRQRINNCQTQKLLKQQLQRARAIYTRGQPLCKQLTGRFAIEIAVIYHGGLNVLTQLEQNTNNIYLRPRLKPKDQLQILWRGLMCHFFNKPCTCC